MDSNVVRLSTASLRPATKKIAGLM